MNERTLLPVLLPLAPAATLPERVAPAVAQVLQLHGIDRDFIVREVAAMADVQVAKTTNCSVVGTMNEFAFEAEVYRVRSGITDLLELALRPAVMPCGAIRGNSPARLLRQMAAGRAPLSCAEARHTPAALADGRPPGTSAPLKSRASPRPQAQRHARRVEVRRLPGNNRRPRRLKVASLS